jgi:hypothetical protein
MAEGFSCSLDILYGGLGIKYLKFIYKKKVFFCSKILQVFGIKTLDPDPYLLKMLDPAPDEKQCGSTTLPERPSNLSVYGFL